MQDLSRLVSNNDIIRKIADLFSPGTYLVGGCIRDMLLGREPSDFDIVTYSDVSAIAREIGSRFNSSTFWMDRKREVLRIALKDKQVTIDISSPKGSEIVEDLTARDITINAMGFDVGQEELIDPLDGFQDLKNGVIRIISEDNLRDDPVRGLRCLRFSVILDFTVTDSTLSLLRDNAPTLINASPERIKHEFVQALNHPHGSSLFRLMERSGLIEAFFSSFVKGDQRGTHKSYNSRRGVLIASEVDGLIYDAHNFLFGLGQDLWEEVEAGVLRSALLRLGAFLYGLSEIQSFGKKSGTNAHTLPLHEIIMQQAGTFCRHFRFSSKSIAMIKRLIGSQKDLCESLSYTDPPKRTLHRLCEKASPYLPEVLLLACADIKGTDRREEGARLREYLSEGVSQVWAYYMDTYRVHIRYPIVNGRDVMQGLGIVSGPRVGSLLRMVREARADGIVRTRQEALDYIQGLHPQKGM